MFVKPVLTRQREQFGNGNPYMLLIILMFYIKLLIYFDNLHESLYNDYLIL